MLLNETATPIAGHDPKRARAPASRSTAARGAPWAVLLALLALAAPTARAFDHTYPDLERLLGAAVRWTPDGHSSTVDYAALQRRRDELAAGLAAMSKVTEAEFKSWSTSQQKAFLINAYNGFTLELVLRSYPDVQSIRDLGQLFRSPWRIAFFRLLGAPRTLDWIEHDTLRTRYRDPRLHFALNCASRGCPALRPEPFVAGRLEQQLDDGLRRFLGDRTRNHFDVATRTLIVSPIFKWYAEDFQGTEGSVTGWLAAHAERLGEGAEQLYWLRSGKFALGYGDYDWTLNDGH